MIDVHHALSISRQLAGISRGSVYYLPKSVSVGDMALMPALTSCTWNTHSCARMLRDQINRAGYDVGASTWHVDEAHGH